MLAQRIGATGHRELTVVNAPQGDRSMQERLDGLADVYDGKLQVIDVANDAAEAKEAVVCLLEQSQRSAGRGAPWGENGSAGTKISF